jgi:hypothetical protein
MVDSDADQDVTAQTATAGKPRFDADAVAAEFRLTDQDKAFALAVLGGAKYTQAARMAGFPQDGLSLRRKASALAGTRKIKRFLERARAAGVDQPDDDVVVDKPQRRRLLSRDAIGHDRQAALRAIEQLNKMDELERAAGEAIENDGFSDARMVRGFLELSNGAVALLHLWMGQGYTLSNLPLLLDVYKTILRDAPEFWASALSKCSVSERAQVERQLSKPNYQLAARVQLWREVGVTIDTAGLSIEIPGSFAIDVVAESMNGTEAMQS